MKLDHLKFMWKDLIEMPYLWLWRAYKNIYQALNIISDYFWIKIAYLNVLIFKWHASQTQYLYKEWSLDN